MEFYINKITAALSSDVSRNVVDHASTAPVVAALTTSVPAVTTKYTFDADIEHAKYGFPTPPVAVPAMEAQLGAIIQEQKLEIKALQREVHRLQMLILKKTISSALSSDENNSTASSVAAPSTIAGESNVAPITPPPSPQADRPSQIFTGPVKAKVNGTPSSMRARPMTRPARAPASVVTSVAARKAVVSPATSRVAPVPASTRARTNPMATNAPASPSNSSKAITSSAPRSRVQTIAGSNLASKAAPKSVVGKATSTNSTSSTHSRAGVSSASSTISREWKPLATRAAAARAAHSHIKSASCASSPCCAKKSVVTPPKSGMVAKIKPGTIIL